MEELLGGREGGGGAGRGGVLGLEVEGPQGGAGAQGGARGVQL